VKLEHHGYRFFKQPKLSIQGKGKPVVKKENTINRNSNTPTEAIFMKPQSLRRKHH
jgi:hypothetical protein